MDLSKEAYKFSAAALPSLLSGPPTYQYDAGNTTDQSLLPQQLPPALLGPQPLLSNDTMEEEEEEGAYGFRKVKMFEMAPFGDPQLEERRQRAIYAKKNRDMKKREVEKLQHEVTALRTANEQCQANLTHMHGVTQDQQRKLQQLQQWLADTRQQLRDRDEEAQNSHKKVSNLKAHLELIAESLEENGMPRRLLLSLLAQT